MLVRIERDICLHLHGVCRLGFVPRLLLAAGLSGYRPGAGALEGCPEVAGRGSRKSGFCSGFAVWGCAWAVGGERPTQPVPGARWDVGALEERLRPTRV